jgi:polyketide cyclase/dehydrase/lipid transport protein
MTTGAWEIAHVVETDASPSFAWNYWTNVAHWADPPAEFALEGPFAPGAQGTTRLPGQEPLHWVIREVVAPNSATIELPVGEGASIFFKWRVDGLADGRTQLTQRIVLAGEKADAFLEQAKAAFSTSPADGMRRLAAAMGEAERSGQESSL